jgi:hypothetical protein
LRIAEKIPLSFCLFIETRAIPLGRRKQHKKLVKMEGGERSKWKEMFLPYFDRFLRPYFSQATLYVTSFFKSLDASSDVPERFWQIDKEDLKCGGAMLGVTLLIWLITSLSSEFSSVYLYWDGPNYVYAGVTLYDIPEDNPWKRAFNYDKSYFACHLPGFPLLIRFCAFFTVGNYKIADLAAILLSSILLTYSFRRVLLVYKCVANPTYSTILVAFLPLRLVIYHSVGASEPLFTTEICFALIFYKCEWYSELLISVWLACITRIEGMAVGAVFGCCYLLRLDLLHAIMMFLTFVAPAFIMALHYAMFGNAFAYIAFNQNLQGLISWQPLPELQPGSISQDGVNYIHSFIDLYGMFILEALLVLPVAGPIGILCVIWVLYVGVLSHMDIFRYSVSAGVFGTIIGLDRLWTHRHGFTAVLCVAPLYLLEILIYGAGQIHSNRAWPELFNEVVQANHDNIH